MAKRANESFNSNLLAPTNFFGDVGKDIAKIGSIFDAEKDKQQKNEIYKYKMDRAKIEDKQADTNFIYDASRKPIVDKQKDTLFGYKMDRAKIEDKQADTNFIYDASRKPIVDKQKDTLFGYKMEDRQDTLLDNDKMAKFIGSNMSYKDFTKEYGDFRKSDTALNAMRFSNKNDTMLKREQIEKGLAFFKTNPDFMENGKFNTAKATSYVTKLIRSGEIDQRQGVEIIDGLHKASNYGIYAKEERGQAYAPTEASRAYRENIKSISDPTERAKWRKENPFIRFRKEYNDAKKMSSGVSSTNLINSSISDFQNKHKINDFANYDFYNGIRKGDISTSEVEALKRVMANSKQAQTLDSEMSKKAGALGEIMGQAKNFARYADSKNVDTNFFKAKVDEVKTYIPGLEYSEQDIENEEFRRDFLNITSTLLKLQSGLAVSDKEVERFEQSMGTLERNKNTNFIGVKKKLEDIRNSFMGIKAIDPQYFNLKYGANVRGLDLSINLIDKAIRRKKDSIVDIKGRHGFNLKVNKFNLFGKYGDDAD